MEIQIKGAEAALLSEFTGTNIGTTIDWNTLMPVVEKIHSVTSEHDTQFAGLVIFELGIASDIKSVYSACVQFILWFNTQKQSV